MAEQKETVVLEFEVDESDSVESINNLTKANKELRAERNALNLQSEAGKKRAQEINALLDQNTNKIKTNVSALEKQKINIGNYKSALDGVHPALGKVGQGLEAGASGFAAMAKSALAFIATPIGAILAALVAVFTLLKTAITTNNELFDKFENITNAVGVVIDVLVNRVGKLGEALIKLASGDFSGAIDSASEAFSGLADELERAVVEGQAILDMTRDLEDAQRQLRIETARQENEIKRLVVASKNRNLTLSEQEDLLRKALSLEQKLVAEREKLAAQDLEIATRTIANEENIQKARNETFEQFANRLIKTSTLTDDQIDPLVEKIEALEQARGSSLAFQEKVENQLTVISEKRAEALRKQNEALAEQAAQERAIRRAQGEDIKQAQKTGADFLADSKAKELQTTTDFNKLMLDANKKFYEDDARLKEQTAKIKEDIDQATLDVTANALGVTASLFDQSTEQFKILATAQTLISTYSAAQKAYESLSVIPIAGPALGAVAAATAVVAGLARVAAINGVQFADGGWTGAGSRLQPAGIVHKDEYVTPKWQVHSSAARPHLQALERQRLRGYADGGLVTDTLSAPINQQLALANIVKSIPPGEVSVVEIARVDRRVKVKEKISKR